MSRRIENIRDLREEIYLLERRQGELKEALRNDLEEIKEEFNPTNIVSEIISKVSGISIGKGFFTKEGFGDGLKSILTQIIAGSGTAFFAKRIFTTAFHLFSGLFRRKKKKKEETNHKVS